MTYKQAKIVIAYAENDMDARATGYAVHLTDGSIAYHLRNVAKETGKDPKRFFDLCWLVGMAAQVIAMQEAMKGR